MFWNSRKDPKDSAKPANEALIKNGKFFVEPQQSSDNFKVLFARLAAQGAGRPVDRDDVAAGPWTPETLADAISAIKGNRQGIDVRTIQVWFQDNAHGISDQNIHWLARVFGCNDPIATSQWQLELKAAKKRLATERNKKRKIGPRRNHSDRPAASAKLHRPKPLAMTPETLAPRQSQASSFASKSERLFLGGGPFGMVVAMWAGVAVLLFVSYVIGVHDVTYSPIAGVEKQVGLFWSPNWLLDKLIWLPLIVIVVSNSVSSWREKWRPALTAVGPGQTAYSDWEHKLAMYSAPFWGIAFVCVFIVFLLQWYGSYLYPLVQNDAGTRVIDWLLVSMERPDVMSISQSMIVSMFGNFLSGVGYWFCFSGFMLLYILSTDFRDICVQSGSHYDTVQRFEALNIANCILRDAFRCTVFALLISIGIKLVAVYLMTDAENILRWLAIDAVNVFGQREDGWTWFDKTPSASITSFFVMFIPVFVFFLCMAQIYRPLQRTIVGRVNKPLPDGWQPDATFAQLRILWLIWAGVIFLLVANFWLIGQFSGFSILLAVSCGLAIYCVVASHQAQMLQNVP